MLTIHITYGQSATLDQALEMYLRCKIHQKPKQWHHWLPLAEWWYNITYNLAIQTSPFQALYGINTPQWALGPYLQTKVDDIKTYCRKDT